MKTLAATIAVLALLVSPSYASPQICTTSTQADTTGQSVVDDPSIPNCVMRPIVAYANGVCEHVQEWTNYGGQTQSCVHEVG